MTETSTQTQSLPIMEQLLAEESYAPLRRGEIRRGQVIAIWPSYVVMDVNAKREGFVPKGDLERLDEELREQVAVGAEFPVYIVRREDFEGRTIVSISRGLVQKDWDRAQALLESQEVCEGEATGCNRGGLLVEFGRLRGFVPASHVVGFPRSLPPAEKREKLTEWIGRRLGFRVIEVEQRRNRLVLSERAAYREWRERQTERLFDELQEGQIVHGQVSNLQDFGAFVDLGGVDGLIHISELSWSRIGHPREVLQVGEEVDVLVIRLDQERKRISLSLRRAGEDPWERIEERYTLGQLVDGRITRIVNFGAFAELEESIEGLIHISELSEERVTLPQNIVEQGEILPLRVIRIDPVRRRLGLSFRRVTASEWEEWRARRLHAEPVPPSGAEASPLIGGDEAEPAETAVPSDEEATGVGPPSEVEATIPSEALSTAAQRAEETKATATLAPTGDANQEDELPSDLMGGQQDEQKEEQEI